jgi:YesN/AraC family two-component response regulator
MESQHLYIKNMVCPRCEIVVRQLLAGLGVKLLQLELGHAEIERVSDTTFEKIEKELNGVGFELLYDRDKKTVEQIKVVCRAYLDKMESQLLITKLSDYLVVNLGKNYSFLSKLFSSHEGMTVESYFLQLKIKRVKQLLSYGEHSLSEIAIRLNYSSVHYLSSQFKKIHGCTVSSYLNKRQQA